MLPHRHRGGNHHHRDGNHHHRHHRQGRCAGTRRHRGHRAGTRRDRPGHRAGRRGGRRSRHQDRRGLPGGPAGRASSWGWAAAASCRGWAAGRRRQPGRRGGPHRGAAAWPSGRRENPPDRPDRWAGMRWSAARGHRCQRRTGCCPAVGTAGQAWGRNATADLRRPGCPHGRRVAVRPVVTPPAAARPEGPPQWASALVRLPAPPEQPGLWPPGAPRPETAWAPVHAGTALRLTAHLAMAR